MLKDKNTEFSEITLQNAQKQNYRMFKDNTTECSSQNYRILKDKNTECP